MGLTETSVLVTNFMAILWSVERLEKNGRMYNSGSLTGGRRERRGTGKENISEEDGFLIYIYTIAFLQHQQNILIKENSQIHK